MRRRRWVGAVLVPVSVVTLCAAQVGLRAPAYAAPRGVPTQAAAKPLQPGTAAAGANLLGVSPGVSSLTLTTMIGESTAALQHEATQSRSAIIDLSTLGVVLATSQFCGRSSLPESQQPQPLLADSETGPHAASHSTLPGVGEEQVTASRSPQSASATTTFMAENLPGIFSASGKSTASVRFVAGKGQYATSNVTEDLTLLGGIVKLEGMKWQATRSAGTTSARATHFSFGQITINGKPYKASTSSSAAGIKAMNRVLAPFGFSFIQPAQTTNSHDGAISIGPMILRFRGSHLERSVISPAGKAVISLEDLLAKNSTAGSNCADFRQLLYNVSTNIETVLNLLLTISEGGGVLDIDFGGATAAAQNAIDYTNPFDVGPGTNPLVDTIGPLTQGSPPSASGVPPLSHPGTATVPPVTVVPQVATPTGATVGKTVCRSTSSAGSQHCWRGIATVASVVALATGAVLLALDLYATRSRRPLLRRRYRRV